MLADFPLPISVGHPLTLVVRQAVALVHTIPVLTRAAEVAARLITTHLRSPHREGHRLPTILQQCPRRLRARRIITNSISRVVLDHRGRCSHQATSTFHRQTSVPRLVSI